VVVEVAKLFKLFLFGFSMIFLISCESRRPVSVIPYGFELGAHWGSFYLEQTQSRDTSMAGITVTVNRDLMNDEELINLRRAVFHPNFYLRLVTENGEELNPRPSLLTIDFGDGNGYILTSHPNQLDIHNDTVPAVTVCDSAACSSNTTNSQNEAYRWVRRDFSSLSFNWLYQVGIFAPLTEDADIFFPLSTIHYFLESHWDDVNQEERLERRASLRGISFDDIESWQDWAEENELDFEIIYDMPENHEDETLEILDVILLFDEHAYPFAIEVFIGPRYVRSYS